MRAIVAPRSQRVCDSFFAPFMPLRASAAICISLSSAEPPGAHWRQQFFRFSPALVQFVMRIECLTR